MRFWDSSAVTPLLVSEARSSESRALYRIDPSLAVWWSMPVECASAVARRTREGTITPITAVQALAALQRLLTGSSEITPTEEIRTRARSLVASHPLRAADSLQLAAALVWCGYKPTGVGFVCLDNRLRAAAQAEGFMVQPTRS